MRGTVTVTFLELFRDTVECHGCREAEAMYRKAGMQNWELVFWFRAIGMTGWAEFVGVPGN